MFYLTYRGKPNKNYFNQSIAGGYIGCWIETTSVENADNIARKLIAEQNWDILDFEEFQTIDPPLPRD